MNQRVGPLLQGTVELELRNVYGNDVLYPHNALARAFAEFKGVKTFTLPMVVQLKDIGFTVIIVGSNARQL